MTVTEQDRIDAELYRRKAIQCRREARDTKNPSHKQALIEEAQQYEGLSLLMLDSIIYPKRPEPFSE